MTSEVLREHPEILFNQTIKKTYKLIKLLGKGATGYVYKGIIYTYFIGFHNDTYEPVAIKAIQMSQINN